MTRSVKPQEFVNIFHPLVTLRAKDIAERWKTSRQYTEVFLPSALTALKNDCILPQVASALDLEFMGQFLHLDAAFYEVERNERDQRIWTFPVVVEHENRCDGSVWEMNKLAYVSAPLRVLITYPHEATDDARFISEYGAVLDATGGRAQTLENPILVAFASREERITWRYYVCTGESFSRLSSEGSR